MPRKKVQAKRVSAIPEPVGGWRFGRVTNLYASRAEIPHCDGVQLQVIGVGDLEVQWSRQGAYGAFAVPREVLRALVLEAADRLGLVVTEKT